MRKTMSRLFMAVLMVALLVGASIMSVSAANEGPTCDGNHEGWTAIGKDGTVTAGGKYYLTEDRGGFSVTGTGTEELTVCLHGHQITSSWAKFGNIKTVNLVNCVKGDNANFVGSDNAFYLDANTTMNIGENVKVYSTKQAIFVQGSSNVNIYGGTIEGTTDAIYLSSGGVNISGGEIVGALSGQTGFAVTGGAFSQDPTAFLQDGYAATLTDGKYVVAKAANEGPTCDSNHLESEGWKGLTVTGDITITESGKYYLKESSNSGCITINNGADVTLCLSGKDIKTSSWAAFYVTNGTLNLVNCSSEGGIISTSIATNAYSVLAAGGTVNIGENIHLDGSACYALWIQTASTVNMYGGTISNNPGVSGNGVVQVHNGTFNMYGGAISKNCGTTPGTAVRVKGTSKFNMSGGTISGNKGTNAGVIYVMENAQFNLSGTAAITENSGQYGVVLSAATFNMTGGSIKNNTVTEQGGAVYLSGGTFTMSGDANIESNNAKTAGGVRVQAGTFNMEGGTISNCKVSDGQSGGGVYVDGGTFNMKNGTITGCSGKYGGGVRNNATFNMTGGTIGGNISTDGGNGSEVYAEGTTNIHGGTINGTTTTTTTHVTITGEGTMDGGNLVGGLWADGAPYEISGGQFSKAPAEALLKTGYVLAEIEDGDCNYKVQTKGFASTGEYMDFRSALGLGVVLEALNDATVTENMIFVTGGYTPSLLNVEGQTIVLASDIAAKDMDEKITFTVKDGDTVLFCKTMSIYEAAKDWTTDADDTDDAMVKDMINYGIEAQKEFEGRASMETLGSTTTAPDWTGVGAANAGVSDGKAELVAATLNLKDQIELNIYVNDAEATVSDVTGATNADPEYVNGITRISFRDIPVNAVKSTAISFKVTLADKATEFTVNYSIADYVKQALTTNSNQKDLLIALQKYVDSVTTYSN